MLAAAIAAALLAASPAPADPGAGPGPAAAAEDPAAQALARKVQSFYEQTRDLSARFRQTYSYAGFGRRQVSSGVLLVKKPGMMRWEYQTPSTKIVAVKGSRLVQYEPEENQAYVDERFDATAMSAALAFLLGKGELEREFRVSLGASGALVLHPREVDPRVDSIELTAGPDGQIQATRVVDGAGNVNEIAFQDVKRNGGLLDSAFDVKLPPDVVRVAPPGR
ncbi:MAG TPA: outer membrane lipoprotein carrier protein LolA [Anaeromyxobacter sp.]|nr:outer membrane lipoprotein carrier protein LolA [Anaeromyxobacter sp.]